MNGDQITAVLLVGLITIPIAVVRCFYWAFYARNQRADNEKASDNHEN